MEYDPFPTDEESSRDVVFSDLDPHPSDNHDNHDFVHSHRPQHHLPEETFHASDDPTSNLEPFPFHAEAIDQSTVAEMARTVGAVTQDKPQRHTPLPTPVPPRQQQKERHIMLHTAGRNNAATTSEQLVEEPTMWDVLAGRGATVNANVGNKRFRASCFARKPEFDAANHAAKKRITSEIVKDMVTRYGTRFLKRQGGGGAWQCLTTEQAMLKAAQVMRDFRRPDRVAQRLACRKRNRATATPMVGVPEEGTVVAPIVELPTGLHQHDVLWGRGAYVNEHVGNQRFRALCIERCEQFHAGTYADKRALATDVVFVIQSLDPPGRFLQKATAENSNDATDELVAGEWIQVGEAKAIQKACQIMRDCKRPDRIKRDEKRRLRKIEKLRAKKNSSLHDQEIIAFDTDSVAASIRPNHMTEPGILLAQHSDGSNQHDPIDDVVAAATEVMNKISQPEGDDQEPFLVL